MMRNAQPSRSRSLVIALYAFTWAAACVSEPEDVPDEPAPAMSAEMMAAMQRDLGQTKVQIERRLQVEASAARIAPALRDQLGSPFAGAWMNDDGTQLQVGITDATVA